MVKEISLTRRLEVGIDVLVGVALDESFIKRYHKEVNDDPHATVSPWTPDNRRVITFHAPLKAPAFVTKYVGVDVLPVSERQYIRFDREEEAVSVETEPLINIAGGERFKTTAKMLLRSAGSNGSEIDITANLTVAIWGVQSAIEAVMCSEARGSFENWVELLQTACYEAACLARGPERPIAAPLRRLIDDVQACARAASSTAAAAAAAAAPSVLSEGEWSEAAFFDCTEFEFSDAESYAGGGGGASPARGGVVELSASALASTSSFKAGAGGGASAGSMGGGAIIHVPAGPRPGAGAGAGAGAGGYVPGGAGASDGGDFVPLWYMQKVMGELSELRVTADATRAACTDLDRRLQRVQADMERMAAAVEGLTGMRAVAAAASPAARAVAGAAPGGGVGHVGAGWVALGWGIAGLSLGGLAVCGMGIAGGYVKVKYR